MVTETAEIRVRVTDRHLAIRSTLTAPEAADMLLRDYGEGPDVKSAAAALRAGDVTGAHAAISWRGVSVHILEGDQ